MATRLLAPSFDTVALAEKRSVDDGTVRTPFASAHVTGTPPAIVQTLHKATADILATPGFHQRMAAIGVEVVGTTPEAYAKIIRDDYEKWGKVVAAAGIKQE